MPLNGYTGMFEEILSDKNIELRLNVNYRACSDRIKFDRMVYTGCIDEFFNYSFGRLPYRSLKFELETIERDRYQPVGTVNYPSLDAPYTRVTEYKHLTGQVHNCTTVAKEYSCAEGEPYYVVPRKDALELYRKYADLAKNVTNVTFLGRLAEYKYYNMDQVVKRSLEIADLLYS
jgi:UDP-galactopyranose mutase